MSETKVGAETGPETESKAKPEINQENDNNPLSDMFKNIDFKNVLSQMGSLFDEGSSGLQTAVQNLVTSDAGIMIRVNAAMNGLDIDDKEELVKITKNNNLSADTKNDKIGEWWLNYLNDSHNNDLLSNFNPDEETSETKQKYVNALVKASESYCDLYVSAKKLGEQFTETFKYFDATCANVNQTKQDTNESCDNNVDNVNDNNNVDNNNNNNNTNTTTETTKTLLLQILEKQKNLDEKLDDITLELELLRSKQ